jgi:hypothetical protein
VDLLEVALAVNLLEVALAVELVVVNLLVVALAVELVVVHELMQVRLIVKFNSTNTKLNNIFSKKLNSIRNFLPAFCDES